MKFLACITITIAFGLAGCGARSSDEQRVRELFEKAEAAAEARDTSDVLALVADDYTDAQGLDREQLKNFLRAYFLAHPHIEVLLGVDALEFPAQGLAHARVSVRNLPLGELSTGDAATLDVELRQRDGEWLVVRADRVTR